MRIEAQRLRQKLRDLIPRLEEAWKEDFYRDAALKLLGYRAYSFCCVYLAYGYLTGWEGVTQSNLLEGADLADLEILRSEPFPLNLDQEEMGVLGIA